MNNKIISILLLLVVVTAFSGVASAASHQVILREAYDEQVLVTPAWNESVLVTPEIPEIPGYIIPAQTHEEQQLVSEAYWIWQCDISDWIDAVYEDVVVVDVPEQIINHPAVYETEVVVDQEAYDEEVLVTPASDKFVGQKEFSNRNGAEGYGQAKVNSEEATSFTVTKVWDCYHYVYVVKLYKHVDAVYEIVHHDAVTHEEQVLVSEAWDEVIPAVTHVESRLVSEGHYQFLGHMEVQTAPNGYSDMIAQCSAAYPGWNMIYHPHSEFAAEYETIVVVDVPEVVVPAVPAVPAVYEIVEHAAVFETIHHDAVFITVEDPIIPIVTPEVPEVAAEEPNTIPMQPTGGSFNFLIGALLAVLGGMAIAFALRRRDE